jgi:CMP-N-acetylneuraminic acid synthetase
MDQPAHGACTMIRRELLEELGGYDEAFRCQDGYDLWLRFIERFNVKNVNLPLFYYRQHATSLSRREGTILDTRSKILKKRALQRGRRLNTVAVIPVRDHNTDPQSIALRPLGDKLVIDWTIESALAAERINAVLVSTPDTDVIKYVERRYGGKIACIRRDPALAQINSFTRPALFHAVQEYASRRPSPDAIAELFIEFPFRTPHVIDSAIDLLEIFSTDRVVGVRPETDGFYTHEGNGLIPLKKIRQLRLEREDIYRVVGAVSVTRPSFLESDAALDSARLGHVVVDQKSSFCIRSEWDWEIAQLEADRRYKKSISVNARKRLRAKRSRPRQARF